MAHLSGVYPNTCEVVTETCSLPVETAPGLIQILRIIDMLTLGVTLSMCVVLCCWTAKHPTAQAGAIHIVVEFHFDICRSENRGSRSGIIIIFEMNWSGRV